MEMTHIIFPSLEGDDLYHFSLSLEGGQGEGEKEAFP